MTHAGGVGHRQLINHAPPQYKPSRSRPRPGTKHARFSQLQYLGGRVVHPSHNLRASADGRAKTSNHETRNRKHSTLDPAQEGASRTPVGVHLHRTHTKLHMKVSQKCKAVPRRARI